MILSTQTDVTFRVFGEEEGIRILAQAGFDAIDYSMFPMSNDACPLNTGDVIAHAEKLRRIAEESSDKLKSPALTEYPFLCIKVALLAWLTASSNNLQFNFISVKTRAV